MKINEAIRHGEILLIKVSKKPTGLKETSEVLNIGSHGHPHGIINGVFYVKKEEPNTLGYVVAKEDCFLTHAEHGIEVGKGLKQAPLEAGIYQVRNQVEDTMTEMRQVVD